MKETIANRTKCTKLMSANTSGMKGGITRSAVNMKIDWRTGRDANLMAVIGNDVGVDFVNHATTDSIELWSRTRMMNGYLSSDVKALDKGIESIRMKKKDGNWPLGTSSM